MFSAQRVLVYICIYFCIFLPRACFLSADMAIYTLRVGFICYYVGILGPFLLLLP
ncbi:hypothetical protein F5B18DRAFT_595306 [Nemania serpens]|nr:hypothetical protein F5B18DRAFT_595306 [Nemania serpens]